MSPEMRSLLEGLLKRVVEERLGSKGRGYVCSQGAVTDRQSSFIRPMNNIHVAQHHNDRVCTFCIVSFDIIK